MAIDTEPPDLTDTDAPHDHDTPFDELAHHRHLHQLRDQTATDDAARVNLRVTNLSDILNGHQPEETPRWLPTPDGRALIYPGRYHDLHGQPSSGKAQPLDARVMTPTGWRRMGDLEIGDQITSSAGTPTRITGIYPQGEQDTYLIRTSDGATTHATADHLWLVNSHNRESAGLPPHVRTTAEMIDLLAQGRTRDLYLPVHGPIQYELDADPLPIDPYLLGALLGDGGLTKGITFTSADPELHQVVAKIAAATTGVTARPSPNDPITVALTTDRGQPNPLLNAIRDLGLFGLKSEQKHIPPYYLTRTTVDERLELVRGLCDTDGWIEKAGSRFGTTSPDLARDFLDLVRGLGAVASITSKTNTYTHHGERRTGQTAYTIAFRLPDGLNPFHLPRKANAYLPTRRRRRRIVSIEPAGRAECQCIAVSAPDRLYITDGNIVTHNTWIALATIAQILNDGDGGILYIDWEDTPGTFVRRLQALGVPNPLIADPTLVTYVNPQGPLGSLEVQALVDHAHHVQAALIVLDALAPALALDGLDENSNTDVTRWIERTVKPFLAQGHAVIGLDHIPKNADNRALGGRGAGAKRAVIDGASYEVMTVTAFSRNRAGEVKLRIAKDRPGMVGPVGAIAAHIHLDPHDDGTQIGIRITAPTTDRDDAGELIPTHLMERVSRHFERLEPDTELSKRGICVDVKGKNEYLRTAVDRLVEYGHLVTDHSGTNATFRLVEPYREPAETATDTPHRAPAPQPRPAAPRARSGVPRPAPSSPKGEGAPGAASEDHPEHEARPVDQTLDWPDGDPHLWDDTPWPTEEP